MIVRDQDVRRFRKQFKALQRRLRQERLPAVDLTRTELQVLAAACRVEGLTPRDIGDELRMASSNVAAALRTLESRGLLVRAPDPRDGRRVNLTATAAGAGLVTDFRNERVTWLGRAIAAQLTAEECALLLQAGDLMERIAGFEPLENRETS